MSFVIRNSKYLVILFIIYLALAPTQIVETGVMRFFPTFVLLIVLFCGIMSFSYGKTARMGTIIACFCIYISICALIHPSVEGRKLITLLKSTYWCWIYFIAVLIFSHKAIKTKILDTVVILATIVFSFSFFSNHVVRFVNFELVGDNAIFYPLLMFPWIASMSNPIKRWIMVVLVALCALTALKRSAIIILIGATALVFYSDFLFRKRLLQSKVVFTALLVIMGLFTIFQYKADSITNVSQRFDLIKDDGGSGRDIIYMDVYNRYVNGTVFNQILGRGFDSVSGSDKTMSLSAHNDFLEVLYDFGIIGFIFYLLIHLSLVKWILRLYRARNQLLFPVLVSYVCFIIMSMVSHLILYPTYFGLLIAFWAYAECKVHELCIQNKCY